MTTAGEIRELATEDLGGRIVEIEEELFRLKIQNQIGQLDNPILIRDLKRDLARFKTVRRERRGNDE